MSQNKVYIGIRGYKGAGKSLFGRFLDASIYTTHGVFIKHTSFAMSLRRSIAEIFGFDFDDVFTSEFKDKLTHVSRVGEKKKLLGRELLQYFGTDVCRKMDPDCWARGPFQDIDDAYYIIDDVRFPNEVKHLRDHNSLLIKIERPGFNGDDHESERALDNFNDDDIIVENNGTKEDLQKEAEKIARIIMERFPCD